MRYIILALLVCLAACATPSGQAVMGRATPSSFSPTRNLITPGPVNDVEPLLGGPAERYTHPSRRFRIDYPPTWLVTERADGVIFIEPTSQAAYSVVFSQAGEVMNEAVLRQFANTFVQENFGDEGDFKILQRRDDLIRFSGVDSNLGPAVKELTFQQVQGVVYLTLITVAAEQWEQYAAPLRELAASLTVNPVTGETPDPTPTPAGPPQWALYAHPGERFALLYPETWQVQEGERSVALTSPTTAYTLTVEVIDRPGAGTDPAIARSVLQDQVDRLRETHRELEALPIAPYQAGAQTGFTVDFLYHDQADEPIANSLIASGVDDKLYLVSLSAPALSYEAALAWFNPIMQSFQIIPEEVDSP